jgi:hypothetical protein
MITPYEYFIGYDWERYASIMNKIAAVSCFALGLISVLFGFNLIVGIWTLLVGVLVTIWEMPQLVSCIPQCEASRKLAEEYFRISNPTIKAMVLSLLSVFCYFRGTLCIIAGVVLDVTAVLNVFAAINRRADAFDISVLTTDDESIGADGGDSGSKLLASKHFGTF